MYLEPIPSSPMFEWMIRLWNIDEDVIIEKGGYDVLYFIRFYKLSFKIFGTFGFYAFLGNILFAVIVLLLLL